ncbi:pyroglutamyl-peptidase I [Anoxybacillus geothermalis]|uniref:Pyrrolidone-carboxylate peptidase n=3 Tax=Geobacillus TaxID=129337 RepID=A0A7U9JBM6_GEOTM|nr:MULTISPECIES: pyroglutamyl-peptidase I [Geobacillus]KFL15050.1 peptidase C15 [Geobacillus stearothermophilus]MED5072529.1 pyroglutamyl-peptidase I [Anoxybacillus geothermalis]AOL34709.1 pyroglutamyl-peptidase I [Geobacillus thermoleovorans]AWO75876.1 pyroglutamyl-peptidase I [Geobacillus thermoleovorans]ESU72541.1 peptidase C15 [Geobacillus sp. MAS1]
MKKLLLTGFEPFLEFPINPTERIATELDGMEIGKYQVYGRVLPVDFSQSSLRCLEHLEQIQPDVVMSLGLAAGRTKITPERVAINCQDGGPDNRGIHVQDEPIVEDGPAAYFSTLPIRRFVNVLNERGYPAQISNTAGTYLCNHVMYSVLHKISSENLSVQAGFVHLPASHELAVRRPTLPSWSHKDLWNAVVSMIEELE